MRFESALKRRWIPGSVLAIAGLMCSTSGWWAHPRGSSVEPAAAAAEDARVPGRSRSDAREPTHSSARTHSPRPRAVVAGCRVQRCNDSSSAPSSAPQPEPEAEPVALQPGPDEFVAWQEKLFERFEQEDRDPTWSDPTEQELRSALSDQPPRAPRVESLECRASMCRVETVHRDLEALYQFTERALKDRASALWQGDAINHVIAGDRSGVLLVSYFLREAARPGETRREGL